MAFRPYAPEDLPAVAALFTESVHGLTADAYDDRQRAAWAPQPPDLTQWARRLQQLQVRLAEADGALLGFIGYTLAGHVDLLFTSPACPRAGVARRLYQLAEDDLRARGIRTVSTEASRVAKPFFARQGFAVVEPQTVTRGGVAFGRYAMRKTLTGDQPLP